MTPEQQANFEKAVAAIEAMDSGEAQSPGIGMDQMTYGPKEPPPKMVMPAGADKIGADLQSSYYNPAPVNQNLELSGPDIQGSSKGIMDSLRALSAQLPNMPSLPQSKSVPHNQRTPVSKPFRQASVTFEKNGWIYEKQPDGSAKAIGKAP